MNSLSISLCPAPQVAECKFLNNRLVGVVAFLENISVKDLFEKVSAHKALVGTRSGSAAAMLPL